MARQGYALENREVGKIVSLLASSDMSIQEIAQRFGCSRSAVVSINRKFQVRQYGKQRTSWELSAQYVKNTEAPA